MAHLIVSNPGRLSQHVATHEAEAIAIGQKMANSTRKPSIVVYFGHDGRREFVQEVRPEKKPCAAARRIHERMTELIDSGMTVEEAAHAITTETMAH